MNESESKTNWIIAVIVAFIIGLGLGWMMWGGNADTGSEEMEGAKKDNKWVVDTSGVDDEMMKEDGMEEDRTAMSKTSTLSTDNQKAGTAVIIKSANLEFPSWIAVREDIDGEFGNILGAQYLPEGVYQDVDVELLRGIIPSGVYHAVIYADDGDRVFNYKKDNLLSNEVGIIQSRFEALAN